MIIGISGKARSGKNVFAEFLAKALFKKTGKGYVLMAYADELKAMAQREFDLSWDQLWGNEKEALDKRYFKSKLEGGLPYMTPVPDSYWTGREIMQSLGEFYRSINPNFWVGKLFSIIDEKEYKNVIVTDVRYPNEVDPILKKSGYHIRIERPSADKIHGSNHASETSLDEPYKVDIAVVNNGTLELLDITAAETADAILKLEKFKED